MAPQYPVFQLAWQGGLPSEPDVRGWPALAKRLGLKESTVRARMAGHTSYERVLTNPDTGNDDILTITKLAQGRGGRPRTPFKYTVRRDKSTQTFDDIASAAAFAGITASTLRHYMQMTGGFIERPSYSVVRIKSTES